MYDISELIGDVVKWSVCVCVGRIPEGFRAEGIRRLCGRRLAKNQPRLSLYLR